MSFRSTNLDYRRGSPKRAAASKIVIVCEGKETEPDYFRKFIAHVRNPLVDVHTIADVGVANTVVTRAIEEKKELHRLAKKSGNSFDKIFQVWAVFDRDNEGPRINSALELARANGIKIGYSNPCFEIWALMHYMPYARPCNQADAQAELKQHDLRYCHTRNPRFSFEQLVSRYDQALRNSKAALRAREEEGNPFGAPCTTIHESTAEIMPKKK